MKPKIPKWFDEAFRNLAAYYNFDPQEAHWWAYYAGLQDLPKETVQQAMTKAVMTLKWMPKVSELRELAGVNLSVEVRAELAFEKVTDIITSAPVISRRINFGPHVNRVVAQMGGVAAIYYMEAGEWYKWGRKRFMELYINMDTTPMDIAPESLSGVSEIKGLPILDLSYHFTALPGAQPKQLKGENHE